jgi:tRNA (guanine37-N1)-methyltransferase
VPPVLMSGHHAEIERWRRREALKRTIERRPDLVADGSALDPEDRALLQELLESREKGAL